MGEDVKFIFRWGFVSVFVFVQTGKHRTPNKIPPVAWLFIPGWSYPPEEGTPTVPHLPHAEEAWAAGVWGCEPHAFRVLKKSAFLQIQSEVHGSC